MPTETFQTVFGNPKLQPITIDFESYYGTKCSLSTLSYTDYVNHEQFDPYMLSIKHGDEPTQVLTTDQIPPALAAIDWDNTIIIGHNLPFDAYVLYRRFGHTAAHYFDTVAAARHLLPHMRHDLSSLQQGHGMTQFPSKYKLKSILEDTRNKRWTDFSPEQQAKMVEYGGNDANVTWEVAKLYAPAMLPVELKMMDHTLQLITRPILELDVERTEKALRLAKKHSQKWVRMSGVSATTLRSTAKFAAELEKRGYEVPTKYSEKQDKQIPAVSKSDVDFLDLFNNKDIYPLLKARLVCSSSINESRLQRLLDLAALHDGKLPIFYNFSGAEATHRFSGTNKTNFQNPTRKGAMRKCIIAPKGRVICQRDLSQIEARVLAYLANDQALLDRFRNEPDVYSADANDLLHELGRPREASKQNAMLRTVYGKIPRLGLGYGMGPAKFRNSLALGAMGAPRTFMEQEEAERIVAAWRQINWRIKMFWKDLTDLIPHMANPNADPIEYRGLTFSYNRITLPSGNDLLYPDLRWDSDEYAWFYGIATNKKLYGGKAAENITQSIARDVIVENILAIDPFEPVVMHTHDDLVTCPLAERAEEVTQFMHQVMITPPAWAPGLPLDAEGGCAANYGECK